MKNDKRLNGSTEIKLILRSPPAIGAYAGLAFGLFFGYSIFSVTSSVQQGTLLGSAFGAVFGTTVGFFFHFVNRSRLGAPPEIFREEIVAQGPANHLKGIDGDGGWLSLTRNHLIFRPHETNFEKVEMVIPLSEIVDVSEKNSLGIFQNGISFTLSSGETERFIVYKRSEWLTSLSALIDQTR